MGPSLTESSLTMDLDIGIAAIARLEDSVTELTKVAAAQRDALVASSTRPRSIRSVGQATADASGNAVIALDMCSVGMQMVVRSIVIGGLTWATTAAGSAVIVVATSAPSPDLAVPLGQVRDYATTLPWVAFYEGAAPLVPVNQSESIYVVVTGGTSGQVYVAAAQYDLWQLR